MILRWAIAFGISMGLVMPASAADGAAKPLLENERVRVTRVDLAKDATIPGDNRYDVATIQLAGGEVRLQEPGQLEKPEPAGGGQVHYFVARSKRSLKNGGKQEVLSCKSSSCGRRASMFLWKCPPTHYCNPGSPKAWRNGAVCSSVRIGFARNPLNWTRARLYPPYACGRLHRVRRVRLQVAQRSGRQGPGR